MIALLLIGAAGIFAAATISSDATAARQRVAPSHPAISIVTSPNSQTIAPGGTATFTITVTNTGNATLTDVTVTDPLSRNCNRSLGTLVIGARRSYICTRTNVPGDFQNAATATGKPTTSATTVQATDHATVKAAPFKPPPTMTNDDTRFSRPSVQETAAGEHCFQHAHEHALG